MIPAPYVNDAVGDGGGGMHHVSGRVVPHFCPGSRIEGIDVMIIASYVNDSVSDGGGGVQPSLRSCSSISSFRYSH